MQPRLTSGSHSGGRVAITPSRPSCDTHAQHLKAGSRLVHTQKRGKNLLPGRQKPEALPPGNIGMRGSLVVRLRPCIISSTPPPPLLPPRLDTTQYTRADISSAQRAHLAFPHCCCSPARNEIWPANFPRSSRRGSFRRGNKRVERTKTPHREQQKYSGGKNRLPSQPREFQPPPQKTKTKKRSTHTARPTAVV